jgi:hypothetical protein
MADIGRWVVLIVLRRKSDISPMPNIGALASHVAPFGPSPASASHKCTAGGVTWNCNPGWRCGPMPGNCQQLFEYSFGGKWLELLKEIAPSVTRVAVIRDPTDSAGIGVFGAVQTAASSVGVELSPVNVRDASEMERAIAAFARGSNGGLILTPGGLAFIHRDLIVTLAARHKLPAVYFSRPLSSLAA